MDKEVASGGQLRYIMPLVLGATICAVQAGMMWRLWSEKEHVRRQLVASEEELEKQTKLRAVERAGRISLQQAKRQSVAKEMEGSGYAYQPIGTVESPFADRRGTPRQPCLVPAARGKIRFDKRTIQTAHFKELDQFSHVWVIFVFHNNTNTEKEGLGARIKPPRLGGAKVGCLSTRSPHRPNNIGLSVCEVIAVGADYIELRCIDMVHGTPVLDVKPYIPYDVVPSNYVLPMATAADGTALPQRTLAVPAWVVDSDIPLLPVMVPPGVREAIQEGMLGRQRGAMVSCSTVDEAVELISQVLRQDIRGVHQGRGKVAEAPNDQKDADSGLYNCVIDGMLISFRTTQAGIDVISVVFVNQ